MKYYKTNIPWWQIVNICYEQLIVQQIKLMKEYIFTLSHPTNNKGTTNSIDPVMVCYSIVRFEPINIDIPEPANKNKAIDEKLWDNDINMAQSDNEK